jgi:hypothetical protein
MSTLTTIYRQMRYGAPVVVVSGLPRSGTSMAMKMLEAGGVGLVVDNLRSADEDNPKGYFEHERVKDLEKESDKTWLRDARGRAIKIISFLLFHLPEDLNYQVIFMTRHLHEVLASQAKMLDHRGEDTATEDARMLKLYENHLWRVRYLLRHKAQFQALEIPYSSVVETPREQAERLNRFLGGRLDVDKAVGAVDRGLYRNRAKALVGAGG